MTQKNKTIRVLLAGGGSGGHIFTLLAVGVALSLQAEKIGAKVDARYFGDAGKYKFNLESAGIRVVGIVSSKLRRYFSLLTILDAIKFLWSFPQALFKIFWFMPDVAFSKGGSGALPILYACRFYKIPIIIHDSDAVPGLTSRVSGKFARRILLAFASAAAYFQDKSKIAVVGNPVRSEIIPDAQLQSAEGRLGAKRALGFSFLPPLVLVLGGSQGAELINNFIFENLKSFLGKFQILHQVGVNNFRGYMERYNTAKAEISEDEQKRYKPVAFLQQDMRAGLAAADIVISRAGAGAIFELAAAGKLAIIVPITDSANGHQKENAFEYQAAGACVVVEEENLFGNLVIREIELMLGNAERLKKMSESAKMFYKPQAAELIAGEIISAI